MEIWLAGREETFRATRKAGDKRGRLERPKQRELERWRPDVIILDESHEYKRPGGRGAQDAWRLVSRLRTRARNGQPYVLLLSGTPNPKGWRDLFAQFRIMDPSIFGTNVGDFDEDHVVYGHGKRRYTILAYRKEKVILKKIRAYSISINAKEAGLAGVKLWQPLYISLPPRAQKLYDQMVENFMTEVDSEIVTAKNVGVLRLRLLQITGGFSTSGKQYHDAKVEAVRDWLQLLYEQEEPFVVGARFLPEVEAIAGAVPRGCRVGVVTGASRRDRSYLVQQFQSHKLDGLVFQVQAGSAAIELSRAAEVVFYSLPDGWVHFKQFGDRVLGPNQKHPVRYTPILARHTMDRNVLEGLRRKEDWHAVMMKDPERFLRGI